MRKNILALFLILTLGTLTLSGCEFSFSTGDDEETPAEETEENTENSDDSEEESEEESEEMSGPMPFSELGMGIMDAKDDYKITFENGEGDCLDQGFPTDLVYGPGNVVKTEDGSYTEDWTSVDFTGTIRFDEVALDSGSAACAATTSSEAGTADITCSVDEEEVCSVTFELFAQK